MKYTPPQDVHSPRSHWTLIDVLDDRGAGDVSLALGKWDGEGVVGMRWNGDKSNPIGNPQSRGLPTWFILPLGPYTDAIVKTLPAEKQTLIRAIIRPKK